MVSLLADINHAKSMFGYFRNSNSSLSLVAGAKSNSPIRIGQPPVILKRLCVASSAVKPTQTSLSFGFFGFFDFDSVVDPAPDSDSGSGSGSGFTSTFLIL